MSWRYILLSDKILKSLNCIRHYFVSNKEFSSSKVSCTNKYTLFSLLSVFNQIWHSDVKAFEITVTEDSGASIISYSAKRFQLNTTFEAPGGLKGKQTESLIFQTDIQCN